VIGAPSEDGHPSRPRLDRNAILARSHPGVTWRRRKDRRSGRRDPVLQCAGPDL